MKKKKKIIIISLVIIILAIILGVVVSFFQNKNKTYNSIQDFNNIKEIVEYYGCKYKKMNNSSEDGFSKDIYISFAKTPIDEKGNTAKLFYEQILNLISAKMEFANYRVIDEEKNLNIMVVSDENKNTYYTVNNIDHYFDNLSSLYTINNKIEDKKAVSNIVSNELLNIINNNWVRRSSNLGQQTSSCDNYDIYWNNGYKVRTINNKIYNIIFTKNYTKEVLQGINTGMSQEEIINVLGEPNYKSIADVKVIGYKFEDIYAFFSDEEISIYRADDYDEEKNQEFAKIMSLLNSDGDYNNFLKQVTEIYPDYTSYTQEQNYINIKYPLRGFEINFGQYTNSGITIYNNYQGKITEEISIDDVKNDKIVPNNTYIELNNNLVFVDELNRASNDFYMRNPYSIPQEEALSMSSKYMFYYNNTYNEYTFYSRDKENQDFKIRIENSSGMYTLTDNLFVYGVKNDGIYVIDANTTQTNKIVDSVGDCKINKIENNIIYYDDSKIEISIR